MMKLTTFILLTLSSMNSFSIALGEGDSILDHCRKSPNAEAPCEMFSVTTSLPTIIFAESENNLASSEMISNLIDETLEVKEDASKAAPYAEKLAIHYDTSSEKIQEVVEMLLENEVEVSLETIEENL